MHTPAESPVTVVALKAHHLFLNLNFMPVTYISTIISKAISISDPDFNLNQVKGSVAISEEVTIPAL